MRILSLQAILSGLNSADVRYVVAGGLAVVAHGYVRFTADVDLMVALDGEDLARAISVLRSLDYVPRAPVPIEAVLDARQRSSWIAEKGLKVFSLQSPAHPATEVDLFLEMPMEFEGIYARSAVRELLPGLEARICSLSDLLAMKQAAGRPRDLEDIRQLRVLSGGSHDSGT